MKKKSKALIFAAFTAFVLVLTSCGTAQNGSSNSKTTKKEMAPIEIDENLSIVDACYTTKQYSGEEVAVKLKIKNNTEQDIDEVNFQFASYDKNEDKVADHYTGAMDIESGHSAWTSYIITDLTLDNFQCIKFDEYQISECIDPSHYKPILSKKLDSRVIVNIDDMWCEDK